jgi:hypothetical protein
VADRREPGATIVEVIVAALVLFVVVTAAFTAIYRGLLFESVSKQRQTATAWADHLMELARHQDYAALGLSDTTAAIAGLLGTVAPEDVDNPDLLLRRNPTSNCLEFNTGTAWERLILADSHSSPADAPVCAVEPVNPDFHLLHKGSAGNLSNDYRAVGTPAVTYHGWVFVTWAPLAGQAGVYYKRVTVMVRFPSPVGGVSRLVRMSSLFSVGYVPAPATTSTPPTTVAPTTTAPAATTTTLPPGCIQVPGDVQGPTGTIAIAGGAGFTNRTAVAINSTVTDLPGSGASGVATMEFSNSGPAGPWQPVPAAAFNAVHGDWPIPPGDGPKQVWARYTDCNGNLSVGVISDTITLDQQPPPAPTLSGTPRRRRIDLSWNAVADPGAPSASGVASYRVYRLGTVDPIATVTGTSYSDTRLTSGQAYTYWVTAVDGAGNESRPESNHYTAAPS